MKKSRWDKAKGQRITLRLRDDIYEILQFRACRFKGCGMSLSVYCRWILENYVEQPYRKKGLTTRRYHTKAEYRGLRKEAIRLREGDLSNLQISRQLGIDPSTLYKWRKKTRGQASLPGGACAVEKDPALAHQVEARVLRECPGAGVSSGGRMMAVLSLVATSNVSLGNGPHGPGAPGSSAWRPALAWPSPHPAPHRALGGW